MKYMVISDIHGSLYYLEKSIEIFNREKFDKLIILGDILYHGPKNPLPKNYSPIECIKLLNNIKDKVIGIRGNCDAEVDCELLEFPIEENLILESNYKRFFLTHGHKYNENNLPKEEFDYLLIGHFHIQKNIKLDNCKVLSPGSISLPKNNSKHGYIAISNGEYKIFDLLTRKEIV